MNGVFTLTGVQKVVCNPAIGFIVTITDTTTNTAIPVTLYLLVNNTLQITTSTLVTPALNEADRLGLTTNNSSPGTTFSYTGNLPGGLTLTPWGLLYGMVTGSDAYSFTVTATDPAGRLSPPQSYSGNIQTLLTPLAITTTSLPVTQPNVNYGEQGEGLQIGTQGGQERLSSQ